MSVPEPATEAEVAAIRALFTITHYIPTVVLEAYRAGVRNGSTVPARVFRPGDTAPGPDVEAVLDCDGDVWHPYGQWWVCMTDVHGDVLFEELVVECEPLIACHPLPDREQSVRADDERRRGLDGGAR